MAIRVVGLTGNIATGKSTVAREFAKLGVPIVDADQLAREVVAPGSEGLREIERAFGREVLAADGSLDRVALGDRVFSDAAARAQLNAITHPRIALLAQERIRQAAESGAPYVLYEAALIVENQLHKGMHALIVVQTAHPLQLERLMARNGLSLEQAHARIGSQMPQDEKAARATFVIANDGAPEALVQRVATIHQALLDSTPRTAPC